VASQSDQSAPLTYQLMFGSYAVILAAALCVYLFSRDAKPQDQN